MVHRRVGSVGRSGCSKCLPVKRGVCFETNAYLPGEFDSLPGAEITQNPNYEETWNQAPVERRTRGVAPYVNGLAGIS